MTDRAIPPSKSAPLTRALTACGLLLIVAAPTMLAPHQDDGPSLRQGQVRRLPSPPLGGRSAHQGQERAQAQSPSVLDDDRITFRNLDADLRVALKAAARQAGSDGVVIRLTSGWRSKQAQARLFERATARLGNEQAASRWVALPATSLHVAGRAVDLGPGSAVVWLGRFGARYGLCQTYRNEPWHFEFRSNAAMEGCPALYADASQDPRLRG